MGYCVEAVAVGLEQLKLVFGSRDERLFEQIVERMGMCGDESVDPEDACTPKECLRHLIMGQRLDAESGSNYAFAIADVARFLGELLPNANWSAMPHATEWIETVDESLAAFGIPEVTLRVADHLLYRGSPIDIPEFTDWPMIGYLTLAEARAGRKHLAEVSYQNIKDVDIADSIREIHNWLDYCDAKERDLLCICS